MYNEQVINAKTAINEMDQLQNKVRYNVKLNFTSYH